MPLFYLAYHAGLPILHILYFLCTLDFPFCHKIILRVIQESGDAKEAPGIWARRSRRRSR
jgi:hypothetical protein